MSEEKKKKEVKVEIRVDDDVAQGVYANFAAINHTDSEFTLDFVYVQPQAPQAKVRSRVITSPRHAKRLLAVLKHNVDRYEARYGKIELNEPQGMVPSVEPAGREKVH